MKIDTKDLVFLLNELDITFNQYLLLVMIKEDLYASLYSYEELNQGFTHEEIQDLVSKGYLEKTNKSSNYIDAYNVTEKFSESLYNADPSAAGEEFWEAFPPYIVIDGKRIPAKTLDRDKFINDYGKKVGRFKKVHLEVMDALRYAASHNMITMGMEKWFLSYQWIEVMRAKQEDEKREQFPSERIF